jgi:hypothetical protein
VSDSPTDHEAITVQATAAGWYPDHSGAAQLRWWDGAGWTEHVQAVGPTPYSLRPAPLRVPEGTPVFSPFIWIIALLPLVGIATLASYDPSAQVASSIGSDPYALYRDPAYLLSSGLGFVTYGTAVLLAYFDRKRLLRDGFDRPFHWAWTFLTSGVYVIGRSVIVRRRAGHGLAPIWVWVGLVVLSTIISSVKVAGMMSTVFQTIQQNS